MINENVVIHTPFIKLSALLKFAGTAFSGAEAKKRIKSGDVFVNGEVCEVPGKKVYPGDKIAVGNEITLLLLPADGEGP